MTCANTHGGIKKKKEQQIHFFFFGKSLCGICKKKVMLELVLDDDQGERTRHEWYIDFNPVVPLQELYVHGQIS